MVLGISGGGACDCGLSGMGQGLKRKKVDLPPEQACPILSSPDYHLARKGSWASPLLFFIHTQEAGLQVQISLSTFFLSLFSNTSVLRVSTENRTSSLQFCQALYTQAGPDRTHLEELERPAGRQSHHPECQAPMQHSVRFPQEGLGWFPGRTLQPQEESGPSFGTALVCHLSLSLFFRLDPYRTLVQVRKLSGFPSTLAWLEGTDPNVYALLTVWVETPGISVSAVLGLRGPDAGAEARVT